MPPADDADPRLVACIRRAIDDGGGWLSFERFMDLALYAPGLGYYANDSAKFGAMPASGSDFVTAPELSALFGATLAVQVRQGLDVTGTREVVEFGAGSGALAAQLIDALDGDGGARVERYSIVDVSGTLRARQQAALARFAPRVRWLDGWPATIEGVVVGNEVLDAMPVQLIAFDGERWQERGVVWDTDRRAFAWADRPTAARAPVDAAFVPGSVTELHRHATAFVTGLAERLVRGLALFVDYGFPAAEYHLPQRVGGTLMAHRAHRADADPLVAVGRKDLTAHVDFTAIALAAQEAGLDVLGYTSQAHFLFNLGLADRLATADLATRGAAARLVHEHEMGELFKVLALARGWPADVAPLGFVRGDRTHRL